jgi:hypothetical protein
MEDSQSKQHRSDHSQEWDSALLESGEDAVPVVPAQFLPHKDPLQRE